MLDRCYLTQGMPTMLIWGDEDPIIPVEHAYNAHAAIPGSRLEIFEPPPTPGDVERRQPAWATSGGT